MAPSSIALIVCAYLIGAIPFGIVMARLAGGPDPRTAGSGNIGATNVARLAGKGAGLMTLLADVLKGALPVLYASRFHADGNALVVSLTAAAAFAGHLFPVYLRFAGGKGVATALGVMFVLSPLATIAALGIFIALVATTRYVSLGSICAAVAMPVALKYLTGQTEYLPIGIAVAMLIIIKHAGNIKRLVAGTENRLGSKKADAPQP